MKIQDIRRENLRRWTQVHGTPQNEKSYFSQLLGGASFGERAARRIERDYGMQEGYLDVPTEGAAAPLKLVVSEPSTQQECPALDEIIELLALFQQSSEKGRDFILKSARSAEKADSVRWVRTNDKA